MPAFKPKANKKISRCNKSIITLDNKHNEKMAEFDNIENIILPQFEKEKANILTKLTDHNLTIEERLIFADQLKDITINIRKNKKKKKNYLLDNIQFVFDYFEKKKKITEDLDNKVKVLHSFFDKKKIKQNCEKDQINTTQQYLSNIDETFLNIHNYSHNYENCPNCNGELIPVEYEGVMICNKCAHQTAYLVEHEKPSYKEPPKEVCFYAYKRINHFREILAQFQAKETTQIPQEVLDKIKLQIKKERISLQQMTNKRAKDILKKLGYNKYYEHIPFIKDKLGIKPPIMSQELEERLCNLFMDIQRPYAKHCPDDRVNFLNYYYVLYKMCELLGETIFLPYFPMLKDPVKRIEQDEIWKKICKELNWEFISTI